MQGIFQVHEISSKLTFRSDGRQSFFLSRISIVSISEGRPSKLEIKPTTVFEKIRLTNALIATDDPFTVIST
jgi:hypothetical protein